MSEGREFQDWTWEQLHICYANWHRTLLQRQDDLDNALNWITRLNNEYDKREESVLRTNVPSR